MFPVKVQELANHDQQLLMDLFTGHDEGFVYFGDKKYLLPRKFLGRQDKVRQMSVRQDDVWVTSYPRSGTTWTQELIWLVMNNMDFEKAKEKDLMDKYIFIESFCLASDRCTTKLKELNPEIELEEFNKEGYMAAEEMESPRFLKTHLPFTLLPLGILETTKMVYVARDPRDVAVSFYHLNRDFLEHGYIGDFKTYWNLFVNNMTLWSPYFEHLKEAWAFRNHKNMLFLFYEELQMDLKSVIQRVINFYEKSYTPEQVEKLCKHLHIDAMKVNKTIVTDALKSCVIKDAAGFVRKGKVGGWRTYFDEEMSKQATEWMENNLKENDIKFPIYKP